MIRRCSVILAFILSAQTAAAAGPADPDWPCIQRRQPALSVAQIWGGPALAPEAEARASDPALRALGLQLALRRTPMEEAARLIAEFAASNPVSEQQALFLATFEQLQTSRSRVMDGITRYAHKQASLDAQIATQRRSFDALMAAEPKDFDAIDKAEVAVDWSTRIFIDRQQSLTYVCETPVILEQRAFALARHYAAAMKSR